MVSYHLPFKKGAEKLEMVQKRVSKGFQSPEEMPLSKMPKLFNLFLLSKDGQV